MIFTDNSRCDWQIIEQGTGISVLTENPLFAGDDNLMDMDMDDMVRLMGDLDNVGLVDHADREVVVESLFTGHAVTGGI